MLILYIGILLHYLYNNLYKYNIQIYYYYYYIYNKYSHEICT